MTQEEYQWNIRLVRDRYDGLNLTYDQAEKVFKYEQDRDVHSGKHVFSVWEEWDYELTTFKGILNEDQYRIYEGFLDEKRNLYEKSLIEEDNEIVSRIPYYEELLEFYETKFLPDFFENPVLLYGLLFNENAKIEYLRSEYRRFLIETKVEILSSHFRHYRAFKPNELKLALLRHRLLHVFPDYGYFEHQMDDPTKAIANYLQSKLSYLPSNIEELLTKKFSELKIFEEDLLKKYHSEASGWRVEARRKTDEEEKIDRVMTMLLIDKKKYGC